MTIFEKTTKGLEEIKDKTHGLSMIERRVLIFIDGKRTFDDLKTLPRVTDLGGIISLLQTDGYIAQTAGSKAPANEAPLSGLSAQSGKMLPPFRELPATFQPEKFNMAKHYMTNTLNHFKGFYGATRLVREIDGCQTHEELRVFYDEWCESIEGTRAGKKRMETLRKDLLAVL
ncbi:MAG: Unknown protein [uncultured Thiotrichaceae bacterium]|uniref:Uncharacterized protein n=1 Tax=uncultured Thiotrichaceae bacterium TaxID=298394 RepID=A0A6S6UHD0_9GAMM|nr:MAG: Unknown protein [uncultured Thiotrichaceae bacterium]